MSEHFERLIINKLKGKLSVEESKELDQWLTQNDSHQKQYDEVEAVWKHTGKFTLAPAIDSTAEWDRLNKSLKKREEKRTHTIAASWVLRAAASIAFIILCSYFIYISFAGNEVVTYASTSMIESMKLPDGSVVTLNKDTRISYHENFENNRSIDLQGEAFFDVERDPDHPFIVNTSTAKVRVLGTSFNVNAKTARETRLYVASGVVRFSSPDEVTSMEFKKGESGSFSSESKKLATNIAVNPIAWKDKVLIFNNTPLSEVFISLEEYFDEDFVVPQSLADCRLTAEFEDPGLKEVLDVLDQVFALSVVRDGDHYVVDGQGCDLNK
jgi:transmembrane sensor